MSEGRDRWSEWLLRRRHGDDPERLKAMLERLTWIRDGVLDRARLEAGDTLLDVGCGDGLIGFGGLDRVGPTGRVIFIDVSQNLLTFAASGHRRPMLLSAVCLCAVRPIGWLRWPVIRSTRLPPARC